MRKESSTPRYGSPWTRDDSILAFDLYCRIPSKQTKANHPAVRELALLLARTPAAVARKLGNFGSFDPALREQRISGLTHTSKLDRQVWDEFHADWNGLVWAASEIRQRVRARVTRGEPLQLPGGPSETLRLVKQRVHQGFFRDSVLSSYAAKCCVTGVGVPECLIASHIVPWSEDERFRTDPTNGLCLSATFDRLFDAGLMTVTQDLVVRLSSRITDSVSLADRELLGCYHGRPIMSPDRFLPSPERLAWHRAHRFVP